MKKPKLQIEDMQPRQVQRADIPPATGYAMIVDGRFKTDFDDEEAAKTAATELFAKYPMLKIEIYDAASKARTPLGHALINGRPTDDRLPTNSG